MNYIKLNADSTTVYPYELWKLREDYPNTSFPQPYEIAPLADFGVYPVQAVEKPTYDAITHAVRELAPVEVNGVWTQQWEVYALDAATVAANQTAYAERIKAEITAQTQARLDIFAQTRGYDNIVSACSYATSTHAKYGPEGRYCVTAREETWDKLFFIEAEVVAGTRPMPTSYSDIEPELPVLAWPN